MTADLARDARAVLLPGFSGTELPAWLEARLRAGLGGVCLFAENIASLEQLRALTAAIREANPLALIAIDEEGGDVTRLHAAEGSPFPGNAILGRLDDVALTAEVGAVVAAELRAAGINLNFAPDVDINSNPDNPVIGIRSFGTDPEAVARHTRAWVAAHERGGVAVSAKHFPGHGDTSADSHHALPVVDLPFEALRERELVPFIAAVEAGASTIMTSHILLPQLDPTGPATFSAPILQGLLRAPREHGGLGFEGVIVSDALDMAGASGEIGIPAAAVRALAGGVDLLCIGTRNTDEQTAEIEAAIVAAVESGALDAARLADAAERVESLAQRLPVAKESSRFACALDLERVLKAFDVREGLQVPAEATLVALETTANIAVGQVPWGPASVGREVVVVREGEPLPAGDGPLIVVGKDLHRREWTRAAVEEARATRPGSIAIDMVWPDPSRAFADIATFGASRAASAALVRLLDRLAGGDAG